MNAVTVTERWIYPVGPPALAGKGFYAIYPVKIPDESGVPTDWKSAFHLF